MCFAPDKEFLRSLTELGGYMEYTIFDVIFVVKNRHVKKNESAVMSM